MKRPETLSKFPMLNLPLLLPLMLPLLPAAAALWILNADAKAFIIWWITLTIPGLLFLPLAGNIFRQSPDHGYLFAKPLALLLSGLTVWTLSTLHLLPFRPAAIYVVILAGAVLVHIPRSNRAFWKDAPLKPGVLIYWSIEETLLGSALLFWTFARGLSPALDSLEKFMDYGFMMSLWRTDFLPAKDMWLAGSSINYYYFGQYLMTFWAKAAGVHPEKAYNLAMASMFALTLCLSFAVALLIGALVRRAVRRTAKAMPAVFAAFAAILLTFGGNGHVFYYGGNPVGRWLHSLFNNIGLTVGTIGNSYWFADATRFIGYNPDTTDKTIHEFPYYSFLVADLHAHVVSLIPVLLMLGLLAVLIARPPARLKQRAGFTIDPLLLILSVLLAIFMMGNYWDFVIYFAISSLVMLFSAGHARPTCPTGTAVLLTGLQALILMVPFMLFQNAFAAVLAYGFAAITSWMISTRFTHPLTVTGARASSIFLLAHLIALPFNTSFEPIAKTIARTVSQTPLIQLWILYGFLFVTGLVLAIDILREPHNDQVRAISRFDRHRFAESDHMVLQGVESNLVQSSPAAASWRIHPDLDRTSGGFIQTILSLSSADRLLLIFFICGLGLLIIPELVYVVDIYSGDYKRANTMFKFTYQAFILLSFVLAYTPVRLLMVRSQRTDGQYRRRIAGVIMLLLFIPSLLYPLTVTKQWLGAFTLARYQGIDGIRPFALKDSANIPGSAPGELADDYAAVQWFNKAVSGQPVILESFGDSYTDFCRISAYTGLPTVMGWQTHEWLWRTSKATPDAYQSVVVPRQNDVRTLYTSTDEQEVRRLITQYQVRYMVIGKLERNKFTAIGSDGKPSSQTAVNESLLQSLGTVAFQSNDLVVIAVN